MKPPSPSRIFNPVWFAMTGKHAGCRWHRLRPLPVAVLVFCIAGCGGKQSEASIPPGEWRYYGGDPGGSRYSSLDQINRSNVSKLQVAWTYHTGEKRYQGAKAAQVRNPHTTAADLAEGKKVYDSFCAGCHMAGGQGPDLTSHVFKYGDADGALFSTIFEGVPNSPMPGLYDSEKVVWQVAAYVKSLRRGGPASDSSAERFTLGWERDARYSVMECTPIVANGLMYIVTLFSKVQALDPASGRVVWSFDPFQDGDFHGLKRAVTYWERGEDKRIYYVAGPRLHALNALTGEPVTSFGESGSIELAKGYDREVSYASYNSPLVIARGRIIVGSALYASGEPKMRGGVKRLSPPGDIVAYDVETGKRSWIFHTIPHPGEFGHDTWPAEAWKSATGANSWGGMTVDEERGLVFAGTAAAYYEPPRHGMNLFANTLLALDAETGKRVWHFQTIHHDVWDLDIACPPNLTTVTREGKKIDAVVQAGKTGLLFVFNRDTGEPVFPVEERPVDPGNDPEDKLWATQPFPSKPPPLSREQFEPTDISAESRAFVLDKLKTLRHGKFYEPPTKNGTVLYPGGITGGVNYGGAAYDPTSGWLYVNSNDIPWALGGSYGGGQFLDQEGYPASKPPWGKISAVDLNLGEIKWQLPLGEYAELTARGIPPTGTENMGGAIVTAGGLVFVGASQDAKFRAFDKASGELLWEVELSAVASATPSTYMVGGKQYIVIAAGGGGGMQQVNMLDAAGPFRSHRQRLRQGDAIVAFALP
jgi:quinoprotein glucose dehydrogenase